MRIDGTLTLKQPRLNHDHHTQCKIQLSTLTFWYRWVCHEGSGKIKLWLILKICIHFSDRFEASLNQFVVNKLLSLNLLYFPSQRAADPLMVEMDSALCSTTALCCSTCTTSSRTTTKWLTSSLHRKEAAEIETQIGRQLFAVNKLPLSKQPQPPLTEDRPARNPKGEVEFAKVRIE